MLQITNERDAQKSDRGVIYGANPTVCWRDWRSSRKPGRTDNVLTDISTGHYPIQVTSPSVGVHKRSYLRGAKTFQKSWRHLKIIEARTVTSSKSHKYQALQHKI